MTDHGIERDRWGRPKLHPPEGGPKQSYTRVSTMKSWTDDKGGLIDWSASMAVFGVMRSKPLQARVSSLLAKGDLDPYQANKGALREIIETAKTLAQSQGRADSGTAMHEFSEMVDAGTLDWSYVPEYLKGPLEAYREATAPLTVVDSEVFAVVDEKHDGIDIRGAGSMDRIYYHKDHGVIVGDLKTGAKEPQYALGCTTQVAIYAHGQRYRDGDFPGNPEFADGTPNADGTAWRKPLHPQVNKSVGVMIHAPLEPVKGRYVCDLYALDLERGWNNLLLGAKLQQFRKPLKLEKL